LDVVDHDRTFSDRNGHEQILERTPSEKREVLFWRIGEIFTVARHEGPSMARGGKRDDLKIKGLTVKHSANLGKRAWSQRMTLRKRRNISKLQQTNHGLKDPGSSGWRETAVTLCDTYRGGRGEF